MYQCKSDVSFSSMFVFLVKEKVIQNTDIYFAQTSKLLPWNFCDFVMRMWLIVTPKPSLVAYCFPTVNGVVTKSKSYSPCINFLIEHGSVLTDKVMLMLIICRLSAHAVSIAY